jgi:hypothetical protein
MQDDDSNIHKIDSDDVFQQELREGLRYWYKILKVGVIVAITLYVVVHSLYFFNFHDGVSNNNADWGTFGDFIGGSLNPLFSLLAFLGLFYTIKLQTVELRSSANQLKRSADLLLEQDKHWVKQNFESTFFKREQIKFTVKRNGASKQWNIGQMSIHVDEFTKNMIIFSTSIHQDELNGIKTRSDFEKYFGNSIGDFFMGEGNYLVSLCDGISFIVELINRTSFSQKDKDFYLTALHLQLNHSELVALFFYCIKIKVEYFESLKNSGFFSELRMSNDIYCPLTKIKDNICKL